MGSGIAAHLASAGVEVLLFDIVPKSGGRNSLAEGAIEKLKKAKPALITHPDKIKHITAGNLDDDLEKLRAGAVVSSNTSAIPLHS